jgi:hypothetical protein
LWASVLLGSGPAVGAIVITVYGLLVGLRLRSRKRLKQELDTIRTRITFFEERQAPNLEKEVNVRGFSSGE